MVFSEFAHKLSSVLRSGDNTVAFTKTLLESILNEDGQSVLEEYKESSYKGFYNGNTKITRLAKKINAFVEPMNFVEYIQGYPDAVVSNICDQFRSEIPDIDPFNAGDKLAELFVKIITEAASDSERDYQKYVVIDSGAFITPPVLTGELVVLPEKEIPGLSVTVKQADPFRDYIDKAVDHYSEKKTLLYAESPRPFYSMYVCNDLLLHKFQLPGFKGDRSSLYRTDITAASLEKESEYNIIQGTGGIGKSMLMTHLFLSSAKEYVAGGRLPVLVLLKDYKEEYPDLLTFIHKAITDFAPDIGCEKLVEKLKNGQVIVLLDGLDEIRSQLKESFDSNLESFIKCYPGNSVFLTSRPIDDFVSYSKFTVYDIVPLRKDQALELINSVCSTTPFFLKSGCRAIDLESIRKKSQSPFLAPQLQV